jgi:hypothetical protein
MSRFFSYYFFLFWLIMMAFACTKEAEPTFNVPGSYRYNSPSLDTKQVFVIDRLTGKYRLIKDSLGSFNRGNAEIADSLNRIIMQEFMESMLQRIDFTSADQATLYFGRLDTVGVIDSIRTIDSLTSRYTLNGNSINFDKFPEYIININNAFEELNFCQEFSLRSERTPSGTSVKRYYNALCSDQSAEKVLQNILASNPGIPYDTISVEFVNYIFSRY